MDYHQKLRTGFSKTLYIDPSLLSEAVSIEPGLTTTNWEAFL